MHKTSLRNQIHTINRYSLISFVCLILLAGFLRQTAQPEDLIEYRFEFTYAVIFFLLLIQLTASHLKQRAIIRYLTDSDDADLNP